MNEKSLNIPFKLLSWENSIYNLRRIQKRLFKTVYVADFKKALKIQKLILKSNFARLLAIREVTQVSPTRKVSGIDGKTSLSFTERFELNEYIKFNVIHWEFNRLKKVSLASKSGKIIKFLIPTISDRVWQTLIGFAIEPAHEVNFHPRSYGFRNSCTVHNLQKLIFLNLSKESFGFQKRVLSLEISLSFGIYDYKILLRKIIAPRGIKLGIFRSLISGVKPSFDFNSEFNDSFDIGSIYANILLNGIEKVHACVRFGYFCLFFLKPYDNENNIVTKVSTFFEASGVNISLNNISLSFGSQGFNFLDWFFKIDDFGNCYSTPSFTNYQIFLKRVKYIINNSNYGAVRHCEYL